MAGWWENGGTKLNTERQKTSTKSADPVERRKAERMNG
jgi:hypothetical protein